MVHWAAIMPLLTAICFAFYQIATRVLSRIDEPGTTYFYSAVVLVRHAEDPRPLIADGEWHGEILPAARGEGAAAVGRGIDAASTGMRASSGITSSGRATTRHRPALASNVVAALTAAIIGIVTISACSPGRKARASSIARAG